MANDGFEAANVVIVAKKTVVTDKIRSVAIRADCFVDHPEVALKVGGVVFAWLKSGKVAVLVPAAGPIDRVAIQTAALIDQAQMRRMRKAVESVLNGVRPQTGPVHLWHGCIVDAVALRAQSDSIWP